jgi:hypothetical protein
MSINQSLVAFNPPVAINAGVEHNNCRGKSIYRTGACNSATVPGQGLVVTSQFDHSRLVVQLPTAVNVVAAGSFVVLNHYQSRKNGMPYNESITVLNAATAPKSEVIYKANSYLMLTDQGIDYVTVEKQINTNNPVYMRFQNPVGVNQGIGFFTDVASADVFLVPRAKWYATDTYTYENSVETLSTTQYKNRLRMTNGFGLAPLDLRFSL